MGLLESLYEASPRLLQDGLVTARGAQLAIRRYGPAYFAYREKVPTLATLEKTKLEELQLEELRALIRHAKAFSPYYRSAYEGIEPDSILCLKDLRKLPVLDKETLRSHSERISTIPPRRAVVAHTGGTTGKSISVRATLRDNQRRMAEIDAFRYYHGFRHGMRRATFSGKHVVGQHPKGVFWRTNWILKQRLYSTFHIESSSVRAYIDNLNTFRPEIIDGFPASIAEIADWAIAKNIRLTFSPVAIFTTSETLTSRMRTSIREAFGVEPRDQYSSSEGAPFVVECRQGRLHFWPHTGVIELDSSGRMLVTGFLTYGTPLIRYDIGDSLSFSSDSCDCGWTGPVVASIAGRAVDYILTTDGRRLSAANLSNFLKYMPNSIVASQYRQESPSALRIDVVVDPGRFRPDHLNTLRTDLEKVVGPGMNVTVQCVDAIERESSGKTKFIKNMVTKW